MSSSTGNNSRKRRRLNDEEESKSETTEETDTLQLILNTETNDLVSAVSSLAINQLDILSKKVKELQNAISVCSMKAVRFDQLDDITDANERRSLMNRLVQHTKSHIQNGDGESNIGNNYFHMNSSASFCVGPEKAELLFDCNMGHGEDAAMGMMKFGGMWGYECEWEYGDENYTPYIQEDAVKSFVRKCGVKGVRDNESNDGGPYYGPYSFLLDLTTLCFEVFKQQNNYHPFGDLEDSFKIVAELEKLANKELIVGPGKNKKSPRN